MEHLCMVIIIALTGAISADKNIPSEPAATPEMEDELTDENTKDAKGSTNDFPHIQFPCLWRGKTFDTYVDGVFMWTMTFDSAGDYYYIGNNRYELVHTVGSFLILRRNDSRIFCEKVDDIQSGPGLIYYRNGYTYAGSLLKPEKIDDIPKICRICRVNSNLRVFENIERGSGIEPSTTYDKDFCDTPVGCNLIGKGDLDSIGCTDNGSLDFANICAFP